MMSTSSKFVVATHILTVLAARKMAQRKDVAVKSDFISSSANTNPVVIRRLIGKLREAGLVSSVAGREGGSWLARKAENISLKEIYEAVEEGPLFHMHYSSPDQRCPVGANIQSILCEKLSKSERKMKESLAETTLADLTDSIMDKSGIKQLLDDGKTYEEIVEVISTGITDR